MDTPLNCIICNALDQNNNRVSTIVPQHSTLDASVSKDFKKQSIKLISQSDYQRIAIDLQHINNIDGSGLGSLLYILQQVTAIGKEVALIEIGKSIGEKLAEASLDTLFDLAEDADQSQMKDCPELAGASF